MRLKIFAIAAIVAVIPVDVALAYFKIEYGNNFPQPFGALAGGACRKPAKERVEKRKERDRRTACNMCCANTLPTAQLSTALMSECSNWCSKTFNGPNDPEYNNWLRAYQNALGGGSEDAQEDRAHTGPKVQKRATEWGNKP